MTDCHGRASAMREMRDKQTSNQMRQLTESRSNVAYGVNVNRLAAVYMVFFTLFYIPKIHIAVKFKLEVVSAIGYRLQVSITMSVIFQSNILCRLDVEIVVQSRLHVLFLRMPAVRVVYHKKIPR